MNDMTRGKTMKSPIQAAAHSLVKPLLLSLIAATLYFVDFAPGPSLQVVFVGDAHAILGVGRRTVRRTAVVTTAVVASDSAAQNQAAADSAAASAAAAPPAPPAAPVGTAVPVGTTITALPAGCISTTVNQAEYFDCAGTYYKPAFQSNELVYVVSQP